MKKLWMLLIALALLVTAVPMFASDVTFSGRMIWSANYDTDVGASAGLVRFRPKLTAKIDDFTSLVAEFRMEGYVVGKDDLSGDVWHGVRVKDAYMTSDVTGALGLDLPITINLKVGQFEPGFTDWSVTDSAWDFYYDWPNKLADVGPYDVQTTAQVDVGFGPAVLHVYSDFLGGMMLGLSGGFGPVSGWLTYNAPTSGIGDGVLGVEARYAGEFGDFKVTPLAYFRYDLNDAAAQDYVFGVSAAMDYSMFHVAAGIEGDSDNALDNLVVDLKVAPVENLSLYAQLFMDLGEDYAEAAVLPAESFTGVDLGVSYMIGAAKYMLGYVIGNDDNTPLPLNGDTFGIANGLYFAVDVSF